MSSLATRLSVTFALFAAAMALVIGVLVYEQTADARVKRARTEALDRLDVATTYYELEARQLFGGVSDDPAGIHAPRSLARAVRTGSRGSLLADGAMWAGRPASGATSGLYLRVPYARSASELRDLRRTIMLTGLIATLVAAFLGVAVARGLARSLRRTAHTAEQMASGDLGARVEVRGKDEVAAVGAVVNRMAAAMSERIER